MAEPTSLPFEIAIVPDKATVKHTGATMECPVRLSAKADNSDLKTLPLEPLVSVRGRNVIVMRGIAKKAGAGTVKELFATDDYEITITGTLYSGDDTVYPEEWVSWLRAICEAKKSVQVISKLTDALGIRWMVVLDWSFPETKNVAWQDYSIRGVSDDPFFELIVKS
jgi:hypothetical protein